MALGVIFLGTVFAGLSIHRHSAFQVMEPAHPDFHSTDFHAQLRRSEIFTALIGKTELAP
jgi:hypothetical protein